MPEPKTITYTCNCAYCDKPVTVEIPVIADQGHDDACVGVVCDECYAEHKDDDESDADYLAALWANPW